MKFTYSNCGKFIIHIYIYISIYIYMYIYIYVCVCVLYMFMFYVSNAGKTDEERSTEPGGILQKLMIFSGKPFKNGWFGATKGWFNSKCRIFSNSFNSKCMTWVSLWAILSAWFKYHWGAILSACTHVLRILTARGPLYLITFLVSFIWKTFEILRNAQFPKIYDALLKPN